MIYRSVMIEKSYQQTQYYRPPTKLTDFNVRLNVLYTVYWESSAEENIHEFHGFWALANVFLLLFSIN